MVIIQVIFSLVFIVSSLNGAIMCMRTKTSLYVKLVVCAIACATLSVINLSLLYDIFNLYPKGFRLAELGIFSSFMFLLSANYGTMDHIVDEGGKEYRKYRLLALLAPIGITTIIILYWVLGDAYLADRISTVIITFPGQAAAYYNLKHAILPDNGLNFIKPMRTFNILSVVYIYFCVLEIIFNNLYIPWAISASSFALAVVGAFIIPTCAKGSKKRTEY